VRKKRQRLTAIEKTRKALERLKTHEWISDFGIIEESSFYDSLGFDAWVCFRADPGRNKRRKVTKEVIDGKFPFQVLSKMALIEMHEIRHPDIPYIVVTRGVTVRDVTYQCLLFLFTRARPALNFGKIQSLVDNISLLCPLKCEKR